MKTELGWVALVLIGLSLTGCLQQNKVNAKLVVASQLTTSPASLIVASSTPVPTVVVRATESLPSPTLVPTQTPEPPVMGYVLSHTIDLSSGLPTALWIRLPDGSFVSSVWGRAISYQGTDDPDVFHYTKGTIYALTGDTVGIWAHSGSYQFHPLFASFLDEYARVDGWTNRSLNEAQERLTGLIGLDAWMCQLIDPTGADVFQTVYPMDGCDNGKLLHLRVAAGAVVPHKKVAEYDQKTLLTKQFMVENFPGTGFETLSMEDGLVIKFCIGRLGDQENDGSEDYLFNRGVIGLKIE